MQQHGAFVNVRREPSSREGETIEAASTCEKCDSHCYYVSLVCQGHWRSSFVATPTTLYLCHLGCCFPFLENCGGNRPNHVPPIWEANANAQDQEYGVPEESFNSPVKCQCETTA
eukprot:Skav230811  [mRNA]  locus=scaffold851:163007:163351:- [translate_table: standard]